MPDTYEAFLLKEKERKQVSETIINSLHKKPFVAPVNPQKV